MARPIPRLAPVIKRDLPLSVDMTETFESAWDVREASEHTGGAGAPPASHSRTRRRAAGVSPPVLIRRATAQSARLDSQTGRETQIVRSRESARRLPGQSPALPAAPARMRDPRPRMPHAPWSPAY